MNKRIARVSADFPCWQSAVHAVENLAGNTVKVTLADGAAFVVRYFSDALDELGSHRRTEAELLTHLYGLDFVPQCYFQHDNGIVYHWVEGQPVAYWSEALLAKLAMQLNTLHQFSQTAYSTLQTLPHLDLMQHIFGLLQQLSPEHQGKWLLSLNDLPPYKESPIATLGHHDLHRNNVILTPENHLVWLDWEYASWSNPAFDLASVIVNNQLDNTQQQLLWRYYLRDNTVIKKTTQLKKLTTAYLPWVRLLNALWHAVKEEREHTCQQ
ncbi:phosphotransferase [Spirabiliibacterium falconis]|uniref:phosphotransferase n=1 Tax=Spirabiliibacterium falconis TaxID=572023 RepID=UPI001AAE1349|nr:phosphotransferase [Spirabiliibacterium falconis]MBE2893786.1 phosphotransferase [Spirabiliibacterium falconis]